MSYLQDLIDANTEVQLIGGTVYEVSSSVIIPSDRRIYSNDSMNPAIIKRVGSCGRMSVVNGSNISIENVNFDWNFDGSWRRYNSAIAFAAPEWMNIVGESISNVTISGCEFYDRSAGGIGTNTGDDSWCVNFSPGNVEQDISNITITECITRETVQLCGNGTLNGTWDGIHINNNVVERGYSAAIAISSLADIERGYNTIFKDIEIKNNLIINPRSIGIFVGQDGSSPDGEVDIDNLLIENNNITMGRIVRFPIAVLVRCGQNPGHTASATIKNNLMHFTKDNGSRNVTIIGSSGVNANLLYEGNVTNGTHDFSSVRTDTVFKDNLDFDIPI